MEIIHEINSIEMTFKKVEWNKSFMPFHWHEKLEVVLPLDNPFSVLIDGIWYEAKKGDIVIIGEQIIHCFKVDNDNTNVLLGQFPYRILLNNGIVPTVVKPVISAYEIAADEDFAQNLQDIFNIISKEQIVMEGEKNPFLQSMFAAFYFLIMRKFSLPDESKTVKKDKKDFFKIVKYVNDHFTEDITVQSIAQDIYMDRGKLSGMFSRYAGVTLNSYINTLRVSKAVQLIDSGSSITETAFESGFQSIRTFNNVYKKMMNSTPGQR